jgi:hypothetical protein
MCARSSHLAVLGIAILLGHAVPPANAGVRGRFDFPQQIVATSITVPSRGTPPEIELYEMVLPVSFRTMKGKADDVEQIEVEVTLNDDWLQIVAYEPQTSLTGNIVGEIEETVTTEEAHNWGGSVGASITIPGMNIAQIGPSAELSDSERTVRTEKVRRRPKLRPVVVAGTTARGRGVFFQFRPAPDVTLEGVHLLTLHIAVPRRHRTSNVVIKCRALSSEDWFLFERQAEIASSQGQVQVVFGHQPATAIGPSASSHSSLDPTHRPCPLCDTPP